MKAVKAGAQLHVSWPSGAASKQYDFAADAPAEKALIAQAMQHMLMQQVLPLSQESVCIARMYKACVSACIVRHTTDRCLLHCIAWVGSGKAA